VLALFAGLAGWAKRPDIMLADFEGRDFGDWEVTGELFEIEAEIEPGQADKFGFDIRAIHVLYDIGRQKAYCGGEVGPLEPVNNKVKFHVLIDRTSIEVFGNDGLFSLSSCMLPADNNKSIGVFCMGGQVKIGSLTVWQLNPIWDR
jgi:sucrose-6-phosphate hydrolase SacC (GH32 family)